VDKKPQKARASIKEALDVERKPAARAVVKGIHL